MPDSQTERLWPPRPFRAATAHALNRARLMGRAELCRLVLPALVACGVAWGCAPGARLRGQSDRIVPTYDVIVAGASLGGSAAAIHAARGGARTLLIAPGTWIGGQATEEGVPFDLPYLSDPVGCFEAGTPCRFLDHPSFGWLEELTKDVRHIYAERYGVRVPNPGGCWLTDCFEPRIVHEALRAQVLRLASTGILDVALCARLEVSGIGEDGLRWLALSRPAGEEVVRGRVVVEATARGEWLALLGVPFRVGRELRAETGEADAPADPKLGGLVQPITWVIAMRRYAGPAPPIPPAPEFEPYLSKFRIAYRGGIFGHLGLWAFRRIVGKDAFPDRDEVSLINTSLGNDFYAPESFGKPSPETNVLLDDPDEAARRLERARTQSLAFAYWLQREAPRGKKAGSTKGHPELGLDTETFGESSPFAPAPYVRESRRISALTTILQRDVVAEGTSPALDWGRIFPDSVGWGAYPLDNHGGSIPPTRRLTLPHTIPFGALVPMEGEGVLAGSKNIGTTHLTNSAYRVHPVEAQIGVAAGMAAALAAANGLTPRSLAGSETRIRELQQVLLDHGAELVPMRAPRPKAGRVWRTIQAVVAAGWMSPGIGTDLDFRAADPVSWRDLCSDVLGRTGGGGEGCPPDLAASGDPAQAGAAANLLGLPATGPASSPLTRADLARLLERALLKDVPIARGRAAARLRASGAKGRDAPAALRLPPDVPPESPYAEAILGVVAAGAASCGESFHPLADLRVGEVASWIAALGLPRACSPRRESSPDGVATEGDMEVILDCLRHSDTPPSSEVDSVS